MKAFISSVQEAMLQISAIDVDIESRVGEPALDPIGVSSAILLEAAEFPVEVAGILAISGGGMHAL